MMTPDTKPRVTVEYIDGWYYVAIDGKTATSVIAHDVAEGIAEGLRTYIDALSSLPAQGVGVKDVWEHCAGMADHCADMCDDAGNGEAAMRLYALAIDIRHEASKAALAPSQPAAVGVTDEMVERARGYSNGTGWGDDIGPKFMRGILEAALRSTP